MRRRPKRRRLMENFPACKIPAVEATEDLERNPPDDAPGTLGGVLYGGTRPVVPETDWVALVHAVAAGNQLALHALYERTRRVVYTLIMRITANRETAEEVTLDVFYDVWRRASGYDPRNGTVLGWIMNQARSRAIDRLRFEQRKKRLAPCAGDLSVTELACESPDGVALKRERAALAAALAVLTPHERAAIEAAFFGELTYAQVAARLNEPVGTIKTRIRSGLAKLRHALAGEERP